MEIEFVMLMKKDMNPQVQSGREMGITELWNQLVLC